MRLYVVARRALAASLLVQAAPSLAFQKNANHAEPTAVGDTSVVSTAPHVPIPATEPCEVTLFENLLVMEQQQGPPGYAAHPDSGTPYTYAPPVGCRGPWAKVLLKVAVTDLGGGDPAKAYVRLGGIDLFEGSLSGLVAQPSPPTWQVERDVTDFTSVLTQARNGQTGLLPEQAIWQYNRTETQATISARLFFYRATLSTPAPKTPDALYRVLPEANTVTLPHNTVRAYLDIYNQEPWWYTCVSNQISSSGLPLFSPLAPGAQEKSGIAIPFQGCSGNAFGEILVSVDGTPAGIAPVFPLLPASLNVYFRNTFNAPVQSPQRLNYGPYRVDLTPFAAVLNEAGEHTIALSRRMRGYLLIYQDKQSKRVSGAVTLNTLVGVAGMPVIDGALQANDDTASGQITTSLDRDFKIKGFVNTSSGRVQSTVHQTSHFQNRQVFSLDGLVYPHYRHYAQHLWLDSQTQQHSKRTKGGAILQDSVLTTAYPLDLSYDMDGIAIVLEDEPLSYPSLGSARAEQQRNLDASYQKGNSDLYTSRLREDFVASRTHDVFESQDSGWQSQSQYGFSDNRGSCYQFESSAIDGAVATETPGVGCTGGLNFLRWYSHPDGSPDSLGWGH